MNRGDKPLQRRAGLVRRTPLKAGKGLERKPKLQAVDGDKSKPAKRKTARDTGPTRKLREAVLERDQHRCARCGRGVTTYPYSLQHRDPRGMGGSKTANRTSNLVTLCGSATSPGDCHNEVESHRAQAAKDGYLVVGDQHPEDVEILLARVNDEGEVRFDFYLLDNVGGVQLALFPSPAPVDPFDYTPEPAEEGDAAA